MPNLHDPAHTPRPQSNSIVAAPALTVEQRGAKIDEMIAVMGFGQNLRDPARVARVQHAEKLRRAEQCRRAQLPVTDPKPATYDWVDDSDGVPPLEDAPAFIMNLPQSSEPILPTLPLIFATTTPVQNAGQRDALIEAKLDAMMDAMGLPPWEELDSPARKARVQRAETLRRAKLSRREKIHYNGAKPAVSSWVDDPDALPPIEDTSTFTSE